MARVEIAREGVKTITKNYLEEGALRWDDKPKVITLNANWSDPDAIIGTATDLRRERIDGVCTITAEIGDLEVPKDFMLTIYCNRLHGIKSDDDIYLLDEAHIKALYATPTFTSPYKD